MQANSPPNEKTAGVVAYGHRFENNCKKFVRNYSPTLIYIPKQALSCTGGEFYERR